MERDYYRVAYEHEYEVEKAPTATDYFHAMVGKINQARLGNDTDNPSLTRRIRREALGFAVMALNVPSIERAGLVGAFLSLAAEDRGTASIAYRTLRLAGILRVAELRGLLGLPIRGPIFPRTK